jgi:hypothetical protein
MMATSDGRMVMKRSEVDDEAVPGGGGGESGVVKLGRGGASSYQRMYFRGVTVG